MKNSTFLLIFVIATLFLVNSTEAQITIVRTISTSAFVYFGAANMDNDPQQELVYAWPPVSPPSSSIYRIIIIDGNSGNIDWQSPNSFDNISIAGFGRPGYTSNYMSPFCDINNDGIKEITFQAEDNGVSSIYIVGLQGTSYTINNNSIPNEISLAQNYPNPFNPTTTIEYQIQNNDFVTIKVYNSIGQLIRTLVNESKQSGEYSVNFDGKDEKGQTVSSGVYYYQLQVGDFVSNKKMLLIK